MSDASQRQFHLVAPPLPTCLRGVLWRAFGRVLVRHSFHNWYGFRRRILRLFGATLDATARIRPGFQIDRPWNLVMGRKASIGDGCRFWAEAPIVIGARSVISQYSVISTVGIDPHAFAEGDHDQAKKVGAVTIGDDAWVATECIVTPGTSVPDGVVIGARSVVRMGLSPWTIASGDPAVSRAPRPYKGERASHV